MRTLVVAALGLVYYSYAEGNNSTVISAQVVDLLYCRVSVGGVDQKSLRFSLVFDIANRGARPVWVEGLFNPTQMRVQRDKGDSLVVTVPPMARLSESAQRSPSLAKSGAKLVPVSGTYRAFGGRFAALLKDEGLVDINPLTLILGKDHELAFEVDPWPYESRKEWVNLGDTTSGRRWISVRLPLSEDPAWTACAEEPITVRKR